MTQRSHQRAVVLAVVMVLLLVASPVVGAAAHVGHAPGGYRWVEAPAGEARGKEPPAAARVPFEAGAAGSLRQAVFTRDRQVLAVFPDGVFAGAATVAVEPVAAAALGPPPAGFAFDSNAYRFSASEAAAPGAGFDLTIRYARLGGRVATRRDGRWHVVPSTDLHRTFQARVTDAGLGDYVVLAPSAALGAVSDGGGQGGGGGGRAPVVIVLVVPILALAALGVVGARRRRPSPRAPRR